MLAAIRWRSPGTNLDDSPSATNFLLDWGFTSFERRLFVRFFAESRLAGSLLSAQTNARMRIQKPAPISQIPPCPAQRGKSQSSGRSIEPEAALDITVRSRREECRSPNTRTHTEPSAFGTIPQTDDSDSARNTFGRKDWQQDLASRWPLNSQPTEFCNSIVATREFGFGCDAAANGLTHIVTRRFPIALVDAS
jgi:hypothetical protein